MTVYELATLTFGPGVGTSKLGGLPGYLDEDPDGVLVGCWQSEISRQNLVLVLRGFPDHESLRLARERVLYSDDPFGCGADLRDFSVETFVPFPGCEAPPPGEHGPYYEFRTYVVPPGGIAPTMAAWAEMVPRRAVVSPPTAIMHAFDGRPRFLHVWGFPTLLDRERWRARVFGEGLWPPSSAPRWLTTEMRSELFLPTDLSPLR